MLPGPDYIYECPCCGNLLKRGSLTSGNTFGAELYSDGKQIASMLPSFPDLTKCKKCDNIIWLSDCKEVGVYDIWDDSANDEMKIKWKNADKVEFLTIHDLLRALRMYKSQAREKTIRIWIWWAFNDRVRDGGKEIFVEEHDKDIWEENCRSLLNLLDKNDMNETIQIAELYRNLGEFEKCIETIDSIDRNNMKWIKDHIEYFEKKREINWIKDLVKYCAKKKLSSVFFVQNFEPSDLPFFQEHGKLKEKNGDYKGALDEYDKAIFLDDRNPFFYILKAGVYEKLENLDLAFENFDKALSIDPNCYDVYINRALVYRHHKKYADAQKDYEKAISLKPHTRSFRITVFNEEDIFRYGKFDGMVSSDRLYKISMYLTHKQSQTDTRIFLDKNKFRHFYFSKKHKTTKKTVFAKQFKQYNFWIAKGIFYMRTYIFRRKVKFIDKMT
jgi:tetratricopeptide (TPR) repeat protein